MNKRSLSIIISLRAQFISKRPERLKIFMSDNSFCLKFKIVANFKFGLILKKSLSQKYHDSCKYNVESFIEKVNYLMCL